jgi:hypothetical protein
MSPTKSEDKWRKEVENALHTLASQQLNQSGAVPSLVAVLRRFAPDQQETGPRHSFAREVV